MKLFKKDYANQIAGAFAALIAVILTATLVLILYVTFQTEKENAIAIQTEFNAKVSQFVTGYFDEMEEMARQTTMNSRLFQIFKSLSDSNGEGTYNSGIIDQINATTELRSLALLYDSTKRISIFNEQMNFVSSDLTIDKNRLDRDHLNKQVNVRHWLDQLEHRSGYLITPPHSDWWSNVSDRTYISLIAPIGNNFGPKAYGVVEVDKDVNDLVTMFSMDRVKGLETYLFYGEDLIVSSDNSRLEGEDIRKLYEEGSSLVKDEKTSLLGLNQMYITASPIDSLNMLVVMARSSDDIRGTYFGIVKYIVAAFLLMYLLIAGLTLYLSRRLSDPLKELSEAAAQISIRQMQLPENRRAPQEVLSLTKSFNQMLFRLDESLQQEMTAQLDALQNQTDSHFLWNMLAVINALASEQNHEAVCRVSEKLSDMLRYINSYRETKVTLREELKCATDYMDLMKEYYEDGFSYQIDADRDLFGLALPKMTLQPLVENCFRHGFSYTNPPWRIAINVFHRERAIHIQIINNGKTIEPSVCEEIARKVALIREQSLRGYKTLQFGGLGLVSSIARMNLLYPDRVDYQITALESRETCVEVILYDEAKHSGS